jgi:3-oxosteroid 1-dehydrogenase
MPDESFDFVVVGSGGGALCAALAMRAAGKSVVVLEKTGMFGGATAISGGVMWIPDNRFMKGARPGADDSRDRAAAYMDAVIGDRDDTPGATRARRTAYLDGSVAMLEFLIGQGIPFRRIRNWPDYYPDAPGASIEGRTVGAGLFDRKRLGALDAKIRPGFLPVPAYIDEAMLLPRFKASWKAKRAMARVIARTIGSKLRGRKLTGAGNALIGWLVDACVRAGVELRTEAPVRELIVADDRVVGVRAGEAGGRIDARLGVLIAAGGFARNQAMLDEHMPGTQAAWSSVPEGDTGDLITEARRLGAATAQMDMTVAGQATLVPGRPAGAPNAGLQGDMAKPHSIVVDQTGDRFVSEAGSYMDFCARQVERNRTVPAIPAWMILDSRFLKRYMLAGTMPGRAKPQAWYDSGFLKKAATIRELADQCGIDPVRLEATVERFNGFARAGTDEDFGRGGNHYHRWLGDADNAVHATLGTLEEGPFYALPVVPGNVGTYGGLVTDENARVLREDGSPIAGLYATGTSTASVMGRTTTGAGASVGPSLTFGYVAARHAAHAHNALPAGA